jgi:aspartyl protease family protein
MRKFSLIAGFVLCSSLAYASDISVVGLFPGKAVLVIDDGSPKTYSVGADLPDGSKLISANESTATIEMHGKRQLIAIGEHVSQHSASGLAQVTLQANAQGHFVAQGQINGGTVQMLVDTGATYIAMPASEAIRLGINYKNGRIAHSSTANGVVPAYAIKLNTVKVGDVELNQVDAIVQESGLPFILLGNSFLNRTKMRRDGTQLTLTKRY